MRARPFAAGEAVRFGWSVMTKNPGVFALARLIDLAGFLCRSIVTFTTPPAAMAAACAHGKLAGAGDAGAALEPAPGAAPAWTRREKA